MRPFHLPSRQLALAFLFVQAVVTGGIMLWGNYADVRTAFTILTKVMGSSAALYAIWEFFRKYLWRWWMFRRIFRWLGLVNFPNFNGTWTGTLNWLGRPANIAATFLIRQTYTDITVQYTGAMSVSHSIAASFAITGEENDHPTFHLIMTFRNERTQILSDAEIADKKLKPHVSHRGTVALVVEGEPPKRLYGALWTEPQTADQNNPHETHGFYNLLKRS